MPTTHKSLDGADVNIDVRHTEALLKAGALQSAIFNSANFSSIATDANGVIQTFNVGAERMLGYTAAEVMNKITPADISDPQEVIARATALSAELGTPITPGFEALVFKASRGIEDIYELTYFRKDGSRFPAVVSVTALRDAQDAIIGYHVLLKAHHYETLFAVDALSAVSEARKHQPDLIILDLGLPAGDGFIVLERLHAITPLSLIPVIVVSARDLRGNRERALKAGAKAFVQKPWNDNELLAIIGQQLGQPELPTFGRSPARTGGSA